MGPRENQTRASFPGFEGLTISLTGQNGRWAGWIRSSSSTLQNAMVEKYDGKVVAIKGGEVLGVYDSYLSALTETAKSHEEGIVSAPAS